jgi:hypothetical protein
VGTWVVRWWGDALRMLSAGPSFLARRFCEEDGLPGQSPAMTAWIELRVSRSPGDYWIVRLQGR